MITLTTPKTVAINGVTQESNTQGVCIGFAVDFLANTITFQFHIGSGAPAAFNIGVYSTLVTLTVNLTTGAWVSSNGFSGMAGGAALNNFINQLKADRNIAESFAAGAS